MTDNEEPQLGARFTYDDIAECYHADPSNVHFVVISAGAIVALRLREDFNPRITEDPAQVWVGDGIDVAPWGETLAQISGPIPVFVKQGGATTYTFLGDHKVLPREYTATEISDARQMVPHGLSRIVFLNKI